MSTTTVAEFTRLRNDVQRLRDVATRLEAERDHAKAEVEEANQALRELGLDVDGDVDAQLAELHSRLEQKVVELQEALA